jgi:hypothetical protein
MFVTKDVVFLELHKTGGTHIGALIEKYLGGYRSGKHNRLPKEFRDRFVFGSVRNPWDWYVSLWAFGCLGKGSVYNQTTSRSDLGYYYRELNKEMGFERFQFSYAYEQAINDLIRKDRAVWRWCYEDVQDPKRFRVWLQRVLDPRNALDIREGFGFSPLANFAGLQTYRFFKLFSRANLYRDSDLTDSDLIASWNKNKLVDYIVRNESLEEGFIQATSMANCGLSRHAINEILSGKNQRTNTSVRNDKEYYYDDASIELINNKEAFLIKLFGYSFCQ